MLRLHNEELVISNNRLKELQRDRGVLVLAYATRDELYTHTHTRRRKDFKIIQIKLFGQMTSNAYTFQQPSRVQIYNKYSPKILTF